MKISKSALLWSFSIISLASSFPWNPIAAPALEKKWSQPSPICPKFVIISMFVPEEDVWYGPGLAFDVLAHNITVPGLSPTYPDVHCTDDWDICQVTVGEAEINAGTSIMSLTLSPLFNFTKTYFMVAGIAGVNPEVATLGSVGLAKYAVQVALSYEIDAREKPDNWTFGYAPFGGKTPLTYPQIIYGTEVFELNEGLRDAAFEFGKVAVLNDSTTAQTYRAQYAPVSAYAVGAAPPSLVKADALCSDVWFAGQLLSSAFANYTVMITNGSGLYGFTGEEENATLEAMLRAALAGLVDFSRIIVMRSGSDFDRQPPGLTAYDNLFSDAGGFLPSLANLYNVGVLIIEGITGNWDSTFEAGIPPPNYIGDILGSLGGTPDFGPGPVAGLAKRSIKTHKRSKRDPKF